jgi:hypothetical protein
MKGKFAALVFALIIFSVETAGSCESFLDSKKRSAVDLAPPTGFVDICSLDSLVCEIFTIAEPVNVREKIIGYFVPADQWERFRKGATMGFSPYLIAQRQKTMSSKEFVELKDYTKKKKGDIWGDMPTPAGLKLLSQTPMGVIDESQDLISIGAVIWHMATSKEAFEKGQFMTPAERDLAEKSGKALEVELTMTSVHTALQIRGESLFLNTYEKREQPFDGESTKALARIWVECVRGNNKN